MDFNCEVVNQNVKTKKEKDYKYKVTEVTLETLRLGSDVVNLVNEEVRVELEDVTFVALVTNVTVNIKKVNKIPLRNYKVKLEFDGTNDEIARLVNKSVEASLS